MTLGVVTCAAANPALCRLSAHPRRTSKKYSPALHPVVSPSRINIQCISCAHLVSRAVRFAAREASVVSAVLS